MDSNINPEELIFDETCEQIDASMLPKHFRCGSHTLNLLASADALKIIKESDDLNNVQCIQCTMYRRFLQRFDRH